MTRVPCHRLLCRRGLFGLEGGDDVLEPRDALSLGPAGHSLCDAFPPLRLRRREALQRLLERLLLRRSPLRR
eukprot:6125637-Pleurochrysis_carterae.AAC.1